MAIEHNDFVAVTTNRQTVLNILRAREREPMHFTSFGSVGGKVQGTGQIGLNTTLNGDSSVRTETDTTVTNRGADGVPTGSAVTDTLTNALTRGATNWTPSAQVQVVTGTDFQIAVNATQDFYRGILGPLSSGIVVHYLRQGFPPDLLSHLVIGRLRFYARITAPDGTQHMVLLKTINNIPDDEAAATEFAEALKCRQLDYQLRYIAESSLPVPVDTLSGLSPEVLGRLRADTKGGAVTYFLDSPARNEFRLALSNPSRRACNPSIDTLRPTVSAWVSERNLRPRRPAAAKAADTAPQAADTATEAPALLSTTPERLMVRATAAGRESSERATSQEVSGAGFTFTSESVSFDDLLPEGYRSELVVDMTIRSVEGILYYLGEYVRNEATAPKLRHDSCPGRGYCIPIIRVRYASQIAAANRFVDVTYRGRSYAVPIAGADLNSESGRSSQVISLVQQLLNMHRSVNELPSTQFVRITN